jgi:hypothetical protein
VAQRDNATEPHPLLGDPAVPGQIKQLLVNLAADEGTVQATRPATGGAVILMCPCLF